MSITDDLGIAQYAVTLLGHNGTSVTSDFESSPANETERILSYVYDTVRDALLTEYLWRFATKRAALAPDTTTPVFEYGQRYTLPTDFLRTIQTREESEGFLDPDWRIEGNYLVTDTAPGSALTITGATQADPVVITIAGHGLSDNVAVYIESVVGMTEINDLVFQIDNPATDTFELHGIDGSGYTAYVSGGTAKQVDVKLEYVAQITTVTEMTSVFIDVFATRLAATISPKLTDNAQITRQMWEMYNQKMDMARNTNAVQGTVRGIDADNWTQARL